MKKSAARISPLMCGLEGRLDDFIVLPSGRKIPPLSLLNLNLMDGILEFRIVQRSTNLIELWLRIQKNTANTIMNRFVSSVREIVGEEVEIKVCIEDELPAENSGKLRRIISEVNED
jgi:phenylacetate-CoA ligase